MRVLMRMEIPVEAGNAAIQSGVLAKLIQDFATRAKPESMYFTASHGKRTMFAVFEMGSSSEIPALCEPLFNKLNAAIDLDLCMSIDDLKAGLAALG
jgi:hypothetical protein